MSNTTGTSRNSTSCLVSGTLTDGSRETPAESSVQQRVDRPAARRWPGMASVPVSTRMHQPGDDGDRQADLGGGNRQLQRRDDAHQRPPADALGAEGAVGPGAEDGGRRASRPAPPAAARAAPRTASGVIVPRQRKSPGHAAALVARPAGERAGLERHRWNCRRPPRHRALRQRRAEQRDDRHRGRGRHVQRSANRRR